MTDERQPNYMPTLDEAQRFIVSNPEIAWHIVAQAFGLGDEDRAEVSGGRFRELWRLCGGAVDKQGCAWVEMDVLPSVLRGIIDAVKKLDEEPH